MSHVSEDYFSILDRMKWYMIVSIIILLYFIASQLILQTTQNNDIRILKDVFTPQEIDYLQECSSGITDITTPCFENFHRELVSRIKSKLNVDYLSIDHARFSNNNNTDAKTFHRDVRPTIFVQEYPDVYTIICYLDEAIIQIGNRVIKSNPGDIVIFNSFYLHSGRDMNMDSTRNRRVLQLFEVFMDPQKELEFKKHYSRCEYVKSKFIQKYVYNSYLDVRIVLEYLHLAGYFQTSCSSGTLYKTLINEKNNYIKNIDGVQYYIDL